jgi:Pectinesterase/Bacterial Ig-like domain
MQKRFAVALFAITLAGIGACTSPETPVTDAGVTDGTGGRGTGGNAPGTGGAGVGGTGAGTGGSIGAGGSARTDGGADVRVDTGTPPTGAGGAATGVGGMTGVGGSGGSGVPGVTLFPRAGAQNLCRDPSLRVTFSGPPTIGTAGRIQVFNAATPGTAVAVVDVGATTFTNTVGGMVFNTTRPVYVDGNTAVVYLPSAGLAYGQTYYVTVDAGAIRGPGGAAFSVAGTTTWRFSTAAAAPANRAALGVALDGSASFCSVQGAIDLVPANNTAGVTITIASGTYHEIIYFQRKSNVTLLGQSRTGTLIAATNNNVMNPSTRGRALVGVDNAVGLTIRNLTIQNLTPQGGSQAEALRLGACDMCVVRDTTVISLQDTLLWDGRIYANNCLIEGNVDYVWGGGAAYFANCEIRTIGRSGPIVQARNPATSYGYVFVDSRITSDAGLTGGVLARIDVGVYPASHVAYVNCQMTSEIAPVGWQLTAGTDTTALRFWEYKSVDAAGNPINIGSRLAGSHQLTDAQAAMMRDPTVVLAGWQPPAN